MKPVFFARSPKIRITSAVTQNVAMNVSCDACSNDGFWRTALFLRIHNKVGSMCFKAGFSALGLHSSEETGKHSGFGSRFVGLSSGKTC